MNVKLSTELKAAYPKAVFGSITVLGVPNMKKHEALEERKREVERQIREIDEDRDSIIRGYNAYFKRWGETFPVKFQIKTVKKGKLPQISVLVDSMFIAELKNRILTSGHDLDAIKGDLIFDVSRGGERYLTLSGKERVLKKDDVILKDEEGILACVLYGPARRTSITLETKNVLYFAWCPYGMDEELIKAHLYDILLNLRTVFASATSEARIHR